MLSILITHYNRPKSLKECLQAIQALKLEYPHEIVVSDDCSAFENIELIKKIEGVRLILSDSNRGLAANLNHGIKACKGDYILYCQEDFLLKKTILDVLPECFKSLDSGQVDMVRFRANYKFNKLIKISEHINKIPKFSLHNFHINTFRYSDHPFITSPDFYKRFGYYLENSSGPYGETEFAIRILKLKATIGITTRDYIKANEGVASVIHQGVFVKTTRLNNGFKRKAHRFARALRQHLEWLLYNPKYRKLKTYKNQR